MTFHAGQIVTADQLNALVPGVTVQSALDTATRTTTSITYTETLTAAGLCAVAFTAPPSGAVRIDWRGEMYNSSAGINCISFNLYTGVSLGSGSLVVAADDNYAARNDHISAVISDKNYAQFYIATGLTAGASYNVSLAQRTNAGTINVTRRLVAVTQLSL